METLCTVSQIFYKSKIIPKTKSLFKKKFTSIQHLDSSCSYKYIHFPTLVGKNKNTNL